MITAIQGAKRPSKLITWVDEDGNAVDLTGSTITAKIERSGVWMSSDGTFTLNDPSNGVFLWQWGDEDIASSGSFSVQFNAAYSAAPTPGKTKIDVLKIYPSAV